MSKNHLTQAIKTDPSAIFKYIDKVQAKHRVDFLSSQEFTNEEIDKMVAGVDFSDSRILLDVLNHYRDLGNNETQTNYFCSNLGKIISSASATSKINNIIIAINEKEILNEHNIENTFRGLKKEQKNKFIKALYENNKFDLLRKKVVEKLDKKTLLDYLISENEKKDENSKKFSNEILNFNNIDLLNEIEKALKTTSTELDRAIATFDVLINSGNPNIIKTALSNLSANELENLMNGLKNKGKDLATYIVTMSQEARDKLIEKNPDLFKEAMTSLAPKEKAKVLGEISSEEKLKDVYDRMDAKEQQEIVQSLNDPSTQSVKDKITRVANNAIGIKNDFKKIRSNIWDNRFAAVSKIYNKFAAKLLEMRVELREKFLTKLGSLHTGEDRLGLIGRAQLLVYLHNSKKYEELNTRLDKRHQNIEKLDDEIEERKKQNVASKEDIAKRKEQMKLDSEVAQARLNSSATLKRLQKITKGADTNKKGKFGKVDFPEEKFSLAWGYILDSAQKGKRTITDMNEEEIRTIITGKKKGVGKMTEEQLSNFTKQLVTRLGNISYERGFQEDLVEAEVEQLAGRSMGMSNYALIISITAITITGLIILLTMILS